MVAYAVRTLGAAAGAGLRAERHAGVELEQRVACGAPHGTRYARPSTEAGAGKVVPPRRPSCPHLGLPWAFGTYSTQEAGTRPLPVLIVRRPWEARVSIACVAGDADDCEHGAGEAPGRGARVKEERAWG